MSEWSEAADLASLAELRSFLASGQGPESPGFSRYARSAKRLSQKLESLRRAFPDLAGVSLSPEVAGLARIKPAEAA